MKLNKIQSVRINLQFLWRSKLNYSTLLFLMTLSFSVFAQEVDDELPTAFFGNWVEDVSQCDAGSYFSVAHSEIGLLVFGLGWSSNEVKVKNMGSYYRLFVYGVSEGGDFESEIKIKMGDDGNLFFIDSDSEEIELVKCDPTEFFEYESEEMALADSGLNVVELGMEGNEYLETFDSDLPSAFYGIWAVAGAQCGISSNVKIENSEEGLFISSLDKWYSREVKVNFEDDVYTLFIKGLSDDKEFETEISILIDEYGRLIVLSGGEEIGGDLLLKCGMGGDMEFVEVEETEFVDGELDVADSVGLESINIELLQGKWQSIEDEASFMVIEGDRMKNYYGGMDEELDNEMIMISDTCMNEADSANGLAEEKNRYLSNPNLDMCWYIEFVDTTSLSLIYMATGNTLTYRRVE